MLVLFICFLLSFSFTALLIRYRNFHEHFSADLDLNSPQKFHITPVPRIGGLAIFLALLLGASVRTMQDWTSGIMLLQILVCSFPVFLFGLIEDLTKRISPLLRLSASFASGLLASFILHASVSNIGVDWLSDLLAIPFVAVVFTCVMVAGLTNSYNIIDGFNGLASMVGIIALGAISYVAYRNNDYTLVFITVVMIATIFGFFVWNFPRGLIFLGDGGAYLVGFLISVLSILLITRNSAVSPWFACLINIYPIFETVFSIWRKKFIKKMSPGIPDGTHLHMLIYGRIARWSRLFQKYDPFSINARTSPYLWLLSCLSVFPAMIWWNNALILQTFTALFGIFYVYIYRSIVQFKTPRWLK